MHSFWIRDRTQRLVLVLEMLSPWAVSLNIMSISQHPLRPYGHFKN